MRKKRSQKKNNKTFWMYGIEYDRKLYNQFIPEVEKILKDQVRQRNINYKVKILNSNKGKYWDSNPINPKSQNEFIYKFFDKKDPKGLEGIWNWSNWGTIGLVKEKNYYQIYYLSITAKNPWKRQKGLIETFISDVTPSNEESIDYHLCNGTKGGALLKTPRSNRLKCVVKGVYIVPHEGGGYSFAHEEQIQTATIINHKLINIRQSWGDETSQMEKIWPEIVGDTIESKDNQQGSSGTGFFIDKEGHILTNYHVVQPNEKNCKIIFRNKNISAKVIAKDAKLDLALLKVKIKNKYFVKFSKKPIKKLQSIIVAGFPGGKELSDDLKFTSGIISSLKGYQDNSSQIQIDAAINFGNSGGPIVESTNGELVAVAVSMLRNEVVEGINFGIKVTQVKDFLSSNKIKVEKISAKHKSASIDKILEESTVYIFC